jgi:hypothetical protein
MKMSRKSAGANGFTLIDTIILSMSVRSNRKKNKKTIKDGI